MQEYTDGRIVCPYCGYDNSSAAKEAYHLAPGTILEGKYIVGRVLGYGGFGVAYIGYDAQLERTVAIKEYLPSGFSTRTPGSTNLTIFAGETKEQFDAGLTSFIEEARRLAKFNMLSGTVDIYDSFLANNTGYIVMEYLSGKTVKELLAAQRMYSYNEALPIILSVLTTLSEVHKSGIVHRDIAPDNIFITDAGEVRLLDFGASRYATTLHSKSLSVILKPGYAPEEQYRSKGNQGPWTDVYATAATFYKMLSGITPEEAMDRKITDGLKELVKLDIDIPINANNAIMNALNISIEDRTQSAEEFVEALITDEVARNKIKIKKPDSGRVPVWMKVGAIVLSALIVVFATLIGTGVINLEDGGLLQLFGGQVLEEGEFNTPGVLNKQNDEAEVIVTKAGFVYQIVGKQYSDKVPLNRVLTQDPLPGHIIHRGATISVVISGGPPGTVDVGFMPDVTYRLQAEAEEFLKAAGVSYELSSETSETVQRGNVISQSIEAGTRIKEGATATIVISLGTKAEEEARIAAEEAEKARLAAEEEERARVAAAAATAAAGSSSAGGGSGGSNDSPDRYPSGIPFTVGMSEAAAVATLQAAGYQVVVDYGYTSERPAGIVVSQGLPNPVWISVSLGPDPLWD
jgi:serine/threonine protein kinase/beta-lactam-binding protein with PASTA domain